MSKSAQWEGGKGSYRRNENKEAYESNWDRIFGQGKVKPRPASETEDKVLKMPKESFESEEDRFERHMKPIREAQNNAK